MPDNARIEDLKRRVDKDPSSIAFAQLAEEYRRAGQCEQAVAVCRAGLAVHPEYLSARVTLGRALVDLGQLDQAQHELEIVLKGASENLAALRGLAEIHHRRGALPDALAYYRSALALARNDPDLEQTVADLSRAVEPAQPPPTGDGLSFEQMKHELARQVLPSAVHPAPTEVPPAPPTPDLKVGPTGPVASPTPDAKPAMPDVKVGPAIPTASARDVGPSLSSGVRPTPDPEIAPVVPVAPAAAPHPEHDRALHAIDALEEWLAAVHAARPDGQS